MIPSSARLYSLAMALFSLTACGTLLDNPTDNLQLAQSGAVSPGSQLCNGGASSGAGGSGGSSAGKGGSSAGTGGSQTAGSAGSNPVGGSGGVAGDGGAAGSGGSAGSSAGAGGSAGSDAGAGGSDAGSGGAAGAGGQGGAGGDAGAAGDGGAGGQGGVAGDGGAAGSAGSGGEAGSGGAAAGAGGSSAGSGGAAGSAGAAGGVVDSPYEIVTSQDFSPFQDAPPTGFEGGLTAVQVGKGEEDFRLYTRDAQQNVQVTRSTEGSWTPGWTPIPGAQTSAEVAVTTDAFGVTHLLALQGQQIVDVQQKKSVWIPGIPVGDALATSGPAAVGSEGGKVEVFVRGAAGDLLHATVAGASATAWSSLGGVLAPGSAPAAVNDGAKIHVFVRWQDDTLGHRSFTASSGWGPWESWAGALSSGPAVASWGPGRLDVFARGQGGTLLYRSRREDGALSAAWLDLQEPLDGAPTAVAFGLAQLQVLLKTPQGGVRTAVLLP
jgi:hypothetical protein